MHDSGVDRAAVQHLLAGRRAPADDSVAHGTERVDIELRGVGNGPYLCRKRDFEWSVDEPGERGGTDSAANPLAHFLSGSATCLLSHYMLCAIADDIAIESLKLRARMRFHRLFEGGRVTDVVYDISISSPESGERIRELAERAQRACYAHNTLAAAGVTLTTRLNVNGDELATLDVSQ